MIFSSLLLDFGKNNILLAQGYHARFNLALQNVVITSNGKCGYQNDAGQWCDYNGNVLSGPSIDLTTAANHICYIEIFDNPSALNSPATGEHASTHHTVTIQTANTNPSGAVNTGYTYNITLEWINIDNSNKNTKTPLNLGDDCVNVVLNLVGNNYLTAPSGPCAALEYNRYDGTASPYLGTYGDRALTIQGSGNLTAKKPSWVNNGAVIGSKQKNSSSDCISNGHIIFNGSGAITAQVIDPTSNTISESVGSYGAAIGGAANCRCGNITIKSGTINAYANTTAAAIGSGGGLTGFGADVSGVIKIEGGTVNTYNRDWTSFTAFSVSYTNTETGVGIGAGSSNANNGGTFRSGAKILISGGSVNVYKRLVTINQPAPGWSRGNIGGGNSNTGGGPNAYAGGNAVVEINGGTVNAANIGGGSANKEGANGGSATVTLKMDGGSLDVSGNIGGGSSVSGTGGQATVNVYAPDNGTAGTVIAGTIGGGNSQSGAGGQAMVNVYGGSLAVTGKIGGGKSFGSGAGGNALIHVTNGSLSCQSIGGGDSQSGTPGSVYNNSLTEAGVFIEGGTLTTGTIGGGSRLSGTAAHGKASVKITGGTIQGQCMMVATGTTSADHCWFEMTGGTIDNTGLGAVGASNYPRAIAQGGAVYVEDSNGTVSISGGTIKNCTGSTEGGAVYMTSGNFSLSGTGSIQDCAATTSGGAVHLANGTVTIDGGSIGTIDGSTFTLHPNSASKGGGIYLGNGKLNIISGAIGYNTASSQGGGAYLNDGTLSMTGGTITHNQAANGGGIYVFGGTSTISNGDISYNTATTSGGGIYVYNGSLTFSNGNINYNLANTTGGGIYVDTNGTLYLKGTATLSKNRVPTDEKGGGVYLLGKVIIGDNSKAPSTILAQDNFAYTTSTPDSYTPTATTRNNIYLPSPTVNNDHKDVITLVENGLSSSSHVGFSVPRNFVPVIYCAYSSTSYNYLDSFLSGGAMDGVVFDDAEIYTTTHQTVDPYDYNHIYLSGTTWVQEVTSLPATGFTVNGNNVTISTNEGLAWLISYVNNLNGVTGDHSDIDVTLTADIDMSAHSWVPVAFTGKTFTGTFDGNGHTISGISCNYLGMTGATQTGSDLALFGNVSDGGSIKNVYLKDASYSSMTSQYVTNFVMGSLVANLGSNGTVSGCTATAELETHQANTVIGGLVGSNGGTVHSSYSASELIGFKMGGLVGDNVGDLYNSFANPLFEYSGESGANAKFVGGLVAENNGTVQNCYVRFSRTQELADAKFGQLAGDNEGSITDCYTPLTFSSDVPSMIVHTGIATSDTYKVADALYLYNRPNDNLVGSTGKTLTEKLNNWVSAQGTDSDYAFWKRTTAGGYATSTHAGNINDDYPIHKMKGMSCAASPDGLFIHYKASLNRMVTDYNTLDGGGTLWLYASPKNAAGTDEFSSVDNDADVKLYIDEDATLLQTANNSLTAYTSQTLKVGSEARWHFISSSLTGSGIGFNYGSDNVPFSWADNPCNVTFSGNNDEALFPSDIPNINKVDLYAFYEPEYHWINMKRNTNSHWHMNSTTTPIVYNGNGTGGNGNETYLVPGKGYLVSIDKDQLLQNKGTLNNGSGTVTVQDITYNEANAWAGLLGYNLLGNPYQSYLDFNAFIADSDNSGLNASKAESNAEPTYAVYDPELGSYIQYKSGSSRGSRSADGMLHPHQGFLIRRTGGSYNATATFKNTMRSTNSTSPFRDEQPAFPLVNLMVTDDEGNADVAVLELGRDTDEGAEKLRANTCKGWLYLHYDNDDYGILFRSEVDDYQPLWFEASEAGTYTLGWETANADFESLTLVDNITGIVTDMLANDSYVFEANPDQYVSRFKIVVGDYKDIDENEASEPVEGPSFAYYANGEIHLVEMQNFASLQIVDMLGRVILSRDASHASAISTTGMASGVYVLRLTTGKGTKIQKMVIE